MEPDREQPAEPGQEPAQGMLPPPAAQPPPPGPGAAAPAANNNDQPAAAAAAAQEPAVLAAALAPLPAPLAAAAAAPAAEAVQLENLPEDQQGPFVGVPLPAPALQQPPQPVAGAAAAFPPQPQPQAQVQPPLYRPPLVLALRRTSSVSSLDECSQRCSHAGPHSALTLPGGIGAAGGHGHAHPSHASASSGHLDHANSCLLGLHNLQKADVLTDVTLVAGDREVRAHKNVLAACSPYFQAMFTGFEERSKKRVTLNGVDPDALASLVDYVYSSSVDVNEDNVQSLLTAANLLQLTDVRDACCDFLQSQLHPTNCLGIRAFADLHGCQELQAHAQTFIDKHMAEVLDSDEFLQLEAAQVIGVISGDTITVPSEEKVYESVLSWVRHDVGRRQAHLPDLMEHVRLPLVPKDYLVQRVDSESLLSHPRCKDYIIEALKYHLTIDDAGRPPPPASSAASAVMTASAAALAASPRTVPRQPVGLPKVMLSIGGQAPKAIRSVECYDFQQDKWFPVTEMDSKRCRCGVAVVGRKVYAVGGFNGSLRVRTVDEYDPARDRWTPVANMEARRSTLGVAVLNDRIYAVGGFDGQSGLRTAEVLDLSPASSSSSGDQRQWRSIASMSTRRSSVGVGVLHGLIYAVGGYDGYSRHCLSSVEVYDAERDAWTPAADMSARRSGAGVGILNGLLYSVGGHDGPLVRKSVECYSAEARRWTPVADMNCCRRNAGVVTHAGLLFVVGGDDGTSNLGSVEAYNPKTDTWTLLPAAMNTGRSYTGVCVIDRPDGL